MFFNSRLIGLSALSAMLLASPTARITNLDPEPQTIRRRKPKFQLKEQSGPVVDSTPMTKREKRRLRRQL